MTGDLVQLSLREIHQKYVLDGERISPHVLRKLQRDSRAGAQKLYKTLWKRLEEQKREKARLDAMLHFERVLWKAGIVRIAGVDEVGIGPLAGPVVAAAVVFPVHVEISGIDDSKRLDEETRVPLEAEIRRKALDIGVGVVEVEEIGRINIYRAGIKAMQLAIERLSVKPQHVLVDARTIPGLSQPQNCFNKGDGINFSIASASIVAKVYRDRLMEELDRIYPGYGFASHKGYATPQHQRAIRELGPSPIHRRSFDYIRELCGEYSELYYDLRRQALRAGSREELRLWESEVSNVSSELSRNEMKKLHLVARRLWTRIGTR